ncbi:hypothetical protein ABZW03_09955 [Kitasatospora sp. NPDC004799]|uniref:hypothetical protein n=1 Tax=Kitasatospora sp. NPDC004799 TaxID=3154460 RepID=UPI0033AFC210
MSAVPARAFEESGAGLEGGAGGGEQEQGTGELERAVEPAGAGGGVGDVGDLGGVAPGQADVELHGEDGQGEGEAADDDQQQGEGAAAEAAAVDVVKLAELGDRGGGGLDAGGQRHRDGEGHDHGEDGRVARVGAGGGGAGRVRRGEAEHDDRDGGQHEQHGHRGEQQPAAVAEPGQARHDHEQHERQQAVPGRAGPALLPRSVWMFISRTSGSSPRAAVRPGSAGPR